MSAPMSAGMFSQRSFATPDTPRGGGGSPRGLTGRHRLGLVAGGATLLAAAPLSAIFDGWQWLFQCAVAVGAIVAAAAAARALRAPVWIQVPAMAAGLLIALTWLFPSQDELLGILPTVSTLEHFGGLLGQLEADVRSSAIPVPGLHSLQFVTVLGVGVVAIMVDLCAVVLRRPALAGLPMLAVYSVPVAVMFGSVPAYTFAIGVAGYLWLLGTDNLDRVRRFGRRFTGDGRDVAAWEPSPLAAAGRKLAVLGVLLAVVLPVGVPGATTGVVDRFSNGFAGFGGSGGGGNPTQVNLFASLDGLLNRNEIVDMFEVRTDDPSPHYLRIGVADQITPEGFDHRLPRGAPAAEHDLSPPADRSGLTLHPHRTEVEVLSGFSMPRLPTYPELVGAGSLNDTWRYDPNQQVVFSNEEDSTGTSYGFEYVRKEFDPAALRQAPPLPRQDPRQEVNRIPEDLREPEVTDLVAELTDGRDNPYDQVLAILGYFTRENEFRYSLDTGDATTGSAIVDFLIVNKRGYCVQFASAMAWMVRELELPSRVAIGFTGGRSRTDGEFTLTNNNAHAWPEVYFEGFGWVPFEPTPSSSIPGSVTPDWAPDPNGSIDPDTNLPVPDPSGSSSAPDTTPVPIEPDFGDAGGTVGGGPGPDEGTAWVPWAVLGGLVVLLLALAAPATSRLRLRRARLRRRGGPAGDPDPAVAPGVMTVTAAAPVTRMAHAAWDELLDTMTDFGVPLDPAETPRLTAARLVAQCRLDSDPAEGATLLGHAEERARYAPTPLPGTGLVAALRTVRRALADQSTRTTRLRARLLPPSTLRRWRQTFADAATGVASAMNRWGELLARLSPRRLLRSS